MKMNKKMERKACEVFKTATDAACESRECLHSMPSSEEEKPLQWVNLLEVNAIAYEQCLRQRELQFPKGVPKALKTSVTQRYAF